MTWRAGRIFVGAAVFAVLTVPITLLTVLPSQGIGAEGEWNVLIGAIILAATTLLFRPTTRPIAVGFFGTLLLASVLEGGFWGRVWWQPVDRTVGRALAPLRSKIQGARQKQAWRAVLRNRPLDLDAAILRAQQLQSGCVRHALARHIGVGMPTADAVTAPDDCQDFRRDALEIAQSWPQRFHLLGDTGWRWQLSPSSVPSRFGGTGFLITMRPDPILGLAGPIIELDGQNVLRTRDEPSAPAHILQTPIPDLRRLRECLVEAGAGLSGDAVWYYFPESGLRKVCREIMVTVSGSPASGSGTLLRLSVRNPEGSAQLWSPPLSVSFTPIRASTAEPRRFELRASLHGRRFLLTADNTFHVTAADRPATASDPPPLHCETDPAIPCN